MSTVKIYHNPRCSKSRKTLEIIEKNGFKPDIIKYLDTPPSVDEITWVLSKLDMDPRELMRKNEVEYKQYFTDDSLSNEALIVLMNKYPKVIERPIVISQDSVVIGRPPESVLDILVL